MFNHIRRKWVFPIPLRTIAYRFQKENSLSDICRIKDTNDSFFRLRTNKIKGGT